MSEDAAPSSTTTTDPRNAGRFDGRALYVALDSQRVSRGMTWRQVAAESGSARRR